MTDEQRRIIIHALGLDQAKIGYRNRYIGPATQLLEGMREAGFLRRYDPGMAYAEKDWLYVVTKRGIAAAGLKLEHIDREEQGDMPE
jgi:hypothetical protein